MELDEDGNLEVPREAQEVICQSHARVVGRSPDMVDTEYLLSVADSSLQNFVPLSVFRCSGGPNREIQFIIKAWQTVMEVMLVMGTVSNHLICALLLVKRYLGFSYLGGQVVRRCAYGRD